MNTETDYLKRIADEIAANNAQTKYLPNQIII